LKSKKKEYFGIDTVTADIVGKSQEIVKLNFIICSHQGEKIVTIINLKELGIKKKHTRGRAYHFLIFVMIL
jgi:hypothetical protein